jgi:predicted XRE-type DNA-binding protein
LKKNQKLREYAKSKNVKLWEVAEVLGMQDSAFSRKLRKELSNTERDNILSIIDKVAENKSKTATA